VKSFAAEKFEAIRFLGFLDHTLSIGAKKAVAHIGFLWTTEVGKYANFEDNRIKFNKFSSCKWGF
jgi:hypothetical protein